MSEHERINQLMRKAMSKVGIDKEQVECFTSMQGEFTSFDPQAKIMQAVFPFLQDYTNPLGGMQGGFICAAIDNVLGPLCFMAAKPGVTTQMNVSYIRPVTSADDKIWIKGEVTAQTNQQIFLQAVVTNKDQKLIAIAHATFMALDKKA